MLLPREHGAYGQLLFPLLSALFVARSAPGAWLLAAAGVAAFLGHEALLVVIGQRGLRAARERRADAKRSLALAGGFGLVCGVVSLTVLPRVALVALLPVVFLVLLVGAAIATGRERSTAGEVLAAVALASLSLPVVLAGAAPVSAALTIFLVFGLVFTTVTVGVRAMIGRTTRVGGPSPAVASATALGTMALLAAGARVGWLSTAAPWAAAPACIVALLLALRPPSPRHLRAVGWTLVGATALTAVILVAAPR